MFTSIKKVSRKEKEIDKCTVQTSYVCVFIFHDFLDVCHLYHYKDANIKLLVTLRNESCVSSSWFYH